MTYLSVKSMKQGHTKSDITKRRITHLTNIKLQRTYAHYSLSNFLSNNMNGSPSV